MAEDEDADEIPDTGAVFCFGKSNFADNQPGKFWIREDLVLQVACGDEHTALITASGRVFTFGSNEWGQLGHGHTKSINKPTCVKGLKSLRATFVACGRSHTLVACDNGSVYGFGSNGEYQLGNNEEDTQYLPVRIQGLEGLSIKMLSGGADHSMALTDKGIVYVWGGNSEGQLGLTEQSIYSVPTELKFEVAAIYISAGYYHSAVITGDGKVYTFGESEGGKLGLTETQLKKLPKPQPVTGLTGKMLSVSCGGNHTIVLTADGTAFSFGDGSSGQLGLDMDILETSLPVEINFPYKIARVSCGENHSAFLTVNGQIYTCGNNRHGKLGLLDDDDDSNDNELCNKFLPNLITRLYNFSVQQISCGGCHTAVLASKSKQLDNFQSNHTSEVINDSNTPILDARQRRRQRNLPPLFNSSVSKNDNSDSNPLNKTKLPSISVQNSKQIIDDDEMSESDDNTEKSSKRRSLLQEAEEDESIRHVDSDLDSDLSEKSELNKQSESLKKESENAKESKNEKDEPKEQNISTPGNEIEILSEHTINSPKEKETSKFTSWLTLRRRQSKEIDAKEKTSKDNKTKQASRLSLFRGKESTSEQNQQDSANDQNDESSKKRNVPEKSKSSTLSRNMQPESSDKQNHKVNMLIQLYFYIIIHC
ncbi:X-linked retinitis pigmentosa GTPase regulator-like isoform X2 [Centruroides vittatus]|uniref:X-linked retinitis pigmentosa GTPase regulator-like isoform X2 n=1 Tax=Centruroides vittatus TaxID=120091 RepID=UPI00350FBE93